MRQISQLGQRGQSRVIVACAFRPGFEDRGVPSLLDGASVVWWAGGLVGGCSSAC